MPRKSAHMVRAGLHSIVIYGKAYPVTAVVALPSGNLQLTLDGYPENGGMITRTPGAKVDVVTRARRVGGDS